MIGTMGVLGVRKWKRKFVFPRRISAVCISLLCYSTMSKLPPYIVRDTGNNILFIYAASCYTFRIIQPLTLTFFIFYEFQQPK